MEDKRITIRPIGISHAGDGFPKEQVERQRLKFSQAATLRDLSEEYAWFSLALMYLHVRLMGRDPWGDYVRDCGRDDTFQITMRFDKPVFKGMEIYTDHEWNHVLWAMPKDQWPDYCEWMGQVAFVDRDLQRVARIRTQTFPIADPLYFDRAVVLPVQCPTVDITVFALDTNHGCIYVQPGDHPLLDLPRVMRSDVTFPDTKVWATAILEGHPNPFGMAEQATQVDPLQELVERVKKARNQDES